MPTLADRHKDVSDAAAGLIVTAWDPGGNDEVVRDYVNQSSLATFIGRKVFVFPLEDGAFQVQRENRSEVLNAFKVQFEILERFTQPGTPTQEWLDERVDFIDLVYSAVDLILPTNRLLGSLWTETLTITQKADLRSVTENKLFFASIEAEFDEIISG